MKGLKMQKNDLKENYRTLYQLLGAWFPERDYEDKSFKEIIEEYKSTSSELSLSTLKSEFETLFTQKNIDYLEVVDTANIYLDNKEQMYKWLHELYGYLFDNK